ncbi:hypothetical protein NLX85_18825 [Micromonospora sp. A3M-1-15]|uniref:hypothetical protein n=1 Tax=Micromonospora sp. A3M-1-15 TaxID=2962035 RepID=UPI0020B72A53|nr:hypothetical protein [Micromonospora sp. A3M-1-15]MCP3785419.1 hypothetical protein [Micromonospora sp. A3M-1-15]
MLAFDAELPRRPALAPMSRDVTAGWQHEGDSQLYQGHTCLCHEVGVSTRGSAVRGVGVGVGSA